MAKEKKIAVLGLGIFGSTLAESLEENGIEVLAVDKDKECVERIQENITRTAIADTTDKDQLMELGLEDFDTVVVSMSKHFEESVLTCLNLIEMAIPHVVATARTKRKKMILESIGVDQVINIEKDFAHKLAKSLIRSDVIDLTELEDGYSIAEIKTPDSWTGKSLKDLNVRSKYHMNVIGISNGYQMNMDFEADYVVQEHDRFIVAAKDEVFRKWSDKH